MSLIDEALKRARMEAAQRAAEGEGLPYPTIPRHLGPRRRRGWLAPAVLALAVLGGVVVGVMLASRGGSPSDRLAGRVAAGADAPTTLSPPEASASPAPATTATGDPAAATTPGPAAGSPITASADEPEPEPAPRRPAAAAAPPTVTTARPTPRPAAPAATEPPPRSAGDAEPVGGSRPAGPAAEPPPPTPPRPAPDSAPRPAAPLPAAPDREATTISDPDSGVLLVLPERADPVAAPDGAGTASEAMIESHVQRLATADGGAIELGGIAWSETGPFALINGRVLAPGSAIEAYTLEAIRPGHVILSGEGRRIQLSLQ